MSPFRNYLICRLHHIFYTRSGKRISYILKFSPRLHYSTRIRSILFQIKNKGSHSIQYTTYKKYMFQFLIRQILIKHQQIISEIQKSLSRILFFQRSPSYMIYHTLRNTDKLFSPTAQTPAQVNFFHVGKKMTIQTSNFTIISQPDKKERPPLPTSPPLPYHTVRSPFQQHQKYALCKKDIHIDQ